MSETGRRHEFAIGERVVDGDQPEADRSAARVVDVPETRASDHRIEAIGKTVAEANPDHPPEASVVAIRFERANGESEPAGAIYHYPATRLRRVSDEWEPAPKLTDGQRERQQLIDAHPEAVARFADVIAQVLADPILSADDLSRAIDDVDLSPDVRGECAFTRDDRYKPEDDAAIVCWQCNGGRRRPAKYRTGDPPGETCERARIGREAIGPALDEWGVDSPPLTGKLDLRDVDRDLSRLRSEDVDSVRLGALRLAYRLAGLGDVDEYHHGRASALLRDLGVAADLPLLDTR